jgi:hypothetical protein
MVFRPERGRNLLASAETGNMRASPSHTARVTGFWMGGGALEAAKVGLKQTTTRSTATAPRSAAQPIAPGLG